MDTLNRRNFLASSALAAAGLATHPESLLKRPKKAVGGLLNTGPQSLTLNTTTTVPNPFTYGGNEPVAVQVCNASGFLLEASAGGLVYLVQAYTALTVPLSGGGQNLSLLPFSGSASAPYNTVSETWLLSGETSPMQDGPLTAAAVAAAISGVVVTATQNFEAASAIALTALNAYNLVLNLTTASYPTGTAQANYATAIVEIVNSSGAQATFQIVAEDVTGNYFFAQEVTMEGNSLFTYTGCLPVAGIKAIYVYPFTSTAATVSVILTAEPYANPADLGYDSFGNLTPNLTSFAVNGKPGGSLVPLGPTAWANANTSGATLIAAPTAGALYIFGIDAVLGGVAAWAEVFVNSGGNPIAVLAVTATVNSTGTDHVDLDGLRTTGAVSMLFSGGAGTPTVVIRYTTGP